MSEMRGMTPVSSQPPAHRDWAHFAEIYKKFRAPLAPSASDVAGYKKAIADRDERVLLLGITPALASLGSRLVAVDNSPRMIADIWPGDDETRSAALGDWAELPFGSATFDAVVGDGSLNAASEGLEAVLGEIRRLLVPGGKAVFRVFCSPEAAETLKSIEQDVDQGWCGNVHALKWRIAMALAAENPQAIVGVQSILATFNEMFPDRNRLALKTGWSFDEIATLDAYVGAHHSLRFPTLRAMLDLAAPTFPSAAVLRSTGYLLAERCPLVVWSAD